MTAYDPIVEILASRGWQPLPPTSDADTRVAYPRADGSELRVERRGAGLWLWVVEHGEKRCFELSLDGELDLALTGIAEAQDDLTIDNHLRHYLQLSSITEVSIVAWEQYE